jgi:hypothetical protein
LALKDIDAHAAQRHVGIARHRRRIGRFLDEVGDPAAFIDRHDAEAAGRLTRHFDAGDRAFGTALDVVNQHDGVVHLVDVIAGENHHVLGLGE